MDEFVIEWMQIQSSFNFLDKETDFIKESTSKRKVWRVQGSKQRDPPNFTILKPPEFEITYFVWRDVYSSLPVKSAHGKSWMGND